MTINHIRRMREFNMNKKYLIIFILMFITPLLLYCVPSEIYSRALSMPEMWIKAWFYPLFLIINITVMFFNIFKIYDKIHLNDTFLLNIRCVVISVIIMIILFITAMCITNYFIRYSKTMFILYYFNIMNIAHNHIS